jgi:formamidopyrimidine-DNA glycosylase
MPELPEVESFRRALENEYGGKTLADVLFRRDDIRYPLSPKIREVLRSGAKIERFGRDGKQLLIETKHGAVNVSLGMSGAFLPTDPRTPKKHEHVTLVFTDGSAVGFVDPRRFGFWKVRETALPHLADPLDEAALLSLFGSTEFKKRTRNIKETLTDQRLIGGVGNIYALEALHLASIRPSRSTARVPKASLLELAKTLPDVLSRAILGGGSSISTYRRLSGEGGDFQEFHRVYGRDGEACLKEGCDGVIKRIVQGGRGSWYCPVCQK